MTEFELKFEIPQTSVLRVAAALKDGEFIRTRLQAKYFDTVDRALAGSGVVVRVRKEGRRWVQTAKAPTGGTLERLEHNVSLARTAKGAEPEVDLARHRGTAVGKAIAKALNHKAGDSYPDLAPMYETDVQRIARLVVVDGSLVEIAFDQGRIRSGAESLPICELEVELKKGQPQHAVALARKCCAEYGLTLSSITKSMKGQRLSRGIAAGHAVSATAPAFGRNATGAQIVAAVLQSCLSQILPNASEIAAASGDSDPDHVHQLRVGIRRLRTALRELDGLTGGFDLAWESALVHVFRKLGEFRDHGHLERDLLPKLQAVGGPALNLALSGTVVSSPGTAVRTPVFQDVLLSLIGFAHQTVPHLTGNDMSGRDAVGKILRTRLARLRSQALKEGKKFTELNETNQHRVRKRLKRLRYLSEFSAPFFKPRKLNAFVAALKPAQEALGVFNDELMALQALRKQAGADPRAWFGVGWLESRRAGNARDCLQTIEAFAKVQPFWH